MVTQPQSSTVGAGVDAGVDADVGFLLLFSLVNSNETIVPEFVPPLLDIVGRLRTRFIPAAPGERRSTPMRRIEATGTFSSS